MKTQTAAKRASIAAAGGVLCGTDFSTGGDTAAALAASLARKLSVPLTLAHALELPGTFDSDTKALRWLTANREAELAKKAVALRKSGLPVREHVAAGQADEMLLKLAQAEKPRLIVLSSLGRRRAGQWLLGSVAERTAERATVPTLILREASRMRAWVRGRQPLKVFVCFNFTASAEVALRWVKQLMAVGPCEVVLGYVNSPVDDYIRIGAGGRIPFDGNPSEVLAILERDMKERARTILGGPPPRCRVEHLGRTGDRLIAMAAEEGADLIVVGSRQYDGVQRLWNRSISRDLLARSTASVAIVPLAAVKGRPVKLPIVRHVLVATDFSDLGNTAIPHAYSLVRGGGLVTLMHVVAPPPDLVLKSRAAGKPEREAGARADANEARDVAARLRALVPAEALDPGVLTQTRVVANRQVGLTIAQAAERLGVDVVCFASHGRSGLTKLLFGSVAQDVIAHVRRPVFVVRAPAC
jgi:nucleotide-binding universal stress UspA family protein